MTANAVVSAVANVPLLLAAVALVVYMAFEAGLSAPGTIFGASGLRHPVAVVDEQALPLRGTL